MTYRSLASFGAIAALTAACAIAQSPASPEKKAAAGTKTWTAPRLPDGHPDLQGVWTNATLTPLERAPQFANKPTLTEEEAAKAEAAAKGIYEDVRSDNAERDRDHAYNSLFFDRGSSFERVDGQIRTSLVIDPPDGHVPRIAGGGRGGRRGNAGAARGAAPDAAEEGAARGAQIGRFDSVKDRPLGERCLLGFGSTSGPPMLPVLYNNNYQIVQTPGHHHDPGRDGARCAHHPHGREPASAADRPQVAGRFDRALGRRHAGGGHHQFHRPRRISGHRSENLHVIERFKRVDDHTILYRFTVDDPKMFTKPWTAEYPFLATDGQYLRIRLP